MPWAAATAAARARELGGGDLEIDRVGWTLGFLVSLLPERTVCDLDGAFQPPVIHKRGAFKQRRNKQPS